MAGTRTTTAVLLMGLTAAVVGVGSWARQDGMQEKSNTQKIEDLVRELTGTIQVSGSIVDQKGAPLRDVEIEVDVTTGFGVSGSSGSKRISAANGRFQVKRSGVLSIDCLFLKAGYYPERRSFSYSYEAADTGEDPGVIRTIVVVLREKPTSAPLEKLEGYLQSSTSGPLSIVYAQKPKPSDFPLTAEERIKRKGLDLERPHFYLEPAIEKIGRLSQILVEINGVAGVLPVLQEGWIEFSQPYPGDGFVAAGIPENYSRDALGFRWMTEAPPTGYEPRLHLSAESDKGEEKVFFYCRVQGKHGKGVVTNMPRIVTNERIESASAIMIVYFNPSGSRDLSYSHP